MHIEETRTGTCHCYCYWLRLGIEFLLLVMYDHEYLAVIAYDTSMNRSEFSCAALFCRNTNIRMFTPTRVTAMTAEGPTEHIKICENI